MGSPEEPEGFQNKYLPLEVPWTSLKQFHSLMKSAIIEIIGV